MEHVSTVSVPPSGKPAGRLIWYACFGVVVNICIEHHAEVVIMAASIADIVSNATWPSRALKTRRIGADAPHAAAGVPSAVAAGEGEPDVVKPTDGDADFEGVLVAAFDCDAPRDSVAEGDAVTDAGGVPLGVGRLEPVSEGVGVGS